MSCKNAVKVLFGGALLFAFLSFSCSQFAFFAGRVALLFYQNNVSCFRICVVKMYKISHDAGFFE